MGNESYMGVEKIYLTWDDVYELLDSIHEQVKDKVRYVTGIPRGGTVLAILYSHRFDITYLEYTSNHYPDLLILDDIADSGKTFENLRKEVYNGITGALHYKESSSFKPDVFAKQISLNYGWIVYPWEKKDSNPIQNYLEN